MVEPSHADIYRDLGHLQGEMRAVHDGLDRIESGMKAGFDKIDKRLTELEAKENQRKGALAFLMVLAGAVGGFLVKFGAFLIGAPLK